MVFYKDKSVSLDVAEQVSKGLAKVSKEILDAAIEVRVVTTEYAYNANEVHIEVRFRDFAEYSDDKISTYHDAVMKEIGLILKANKVACRYSFYIIPTMPPRSMWAQAKS